MLFLLSYIQNMLAISVINLEDNHMANGLIITTIITNNIFNVGATITQKQFSCRLSESIDVNVNHELKYNNGCNNFVFVGRFLLTLH